MFEKDGMVRKESDPTITEMQEKGLRKRSKQIDDCLTGVQKDERPKRGITIEALEDEEETC